MILLFQNYIDSPIVSAANPTESLMVGAANPTENPIVGAAQPTGDAQTYYLITVPLELVSVRDPTTGSSATPEQSNPIVGSAAPEQYDPMVGARHFPKLHGLPRESLFPTARKLPLFKLRHPSHFPRLHKMPHYMLGSPYDPASDDQSSAIVGLAYPADENVGSPSRVPQTIDNIKPPMVSMQKKICNRSVQEAVATKTTRDVQGVSDITGDEMTTKEIEEQFKIKSEAEENKVGQTTRLPKIERTTTQKPAVEKLENKVKVEKSMVKVKTEKSKMFKAMKEVEKKPRGGKKSIDSEV